MQNVDLTGDTGSYSDQDSGGIDMESILESMRMVQDAPVGYACGAEMECALLNACSKPSSPSKDSPDVVSVWGTPLRQYPCLSEIEKNLCKGVGMIFRSRKEWDLFLELEPKKRSRWVLYCLFDDDQYLRKVYGRHPCPDTSATMFLLDLDNKSHS